MKKIIILSCMLLIVGCGKWVAVTTIPRTKLMETIPTTSHIDTTPKTQTDSVKSKKFYDKNYKIGEIRTAFIGQEIIKIRPYIITTTKKTTTTKTKINKKTISYSLKRIATSRDPFYIEIREFLRTYKIKSEALKDYSIAKSIEIEGQIYDVIFLPDDHGNRWGIIIDDKGEIFKSGLYSNYMVYYPKTISITPAKFDILSKKIPEPEVETEVEAEPSVESNVDEKTYYDSPYELIYSGKNNVSLNVIYREYTPNDIARTAFFQNITYQADAKNIRFKDFVIKILSASNEKIVYTVLKDGLD